MITCYAQPDKEKSRRVLEAFAAGVGGSMALTTATCLEPGDAAFYGVRPAWVHLWEQAKSRRWYYLDNAWFDAGREQFFRIGVNEPQTWTKRPSDGKRLKALGVTVKPWKSGAHIVVAETSDEFMRCVAGWRGGVADWRARVLGQLRGRTDRRVILRAKGCGRPLAADLEGAHALIAHGSASAIEALISGIPVIVTDPDCPAADFAMPFDSIESPTRPDGREEWAARLADSQWTLDELRGMNEAISRHLAT